MIGNMLDVIGLDGETELAYETLLAELRQALARAQELTERCRQASVSHDPTGLVEVVIGREATAQRVMRVQREARRSLRYFDKPPYAMDVSGSNMAEADLLRRGGTARTIYERASLELANRFSHLEHIVAGGEQARILPTLPMKLILVDSSLAMAPLQAAPESVESCVIVHRSALLEALSALFETLWSLAMPIDPLRAAPPGQPTQPTAEERRILALMTAGLSDEAISRKLGLSYRTLQRRIHNLMSRLQVRTRFQLGAQAGRHMWLFGDTSQGDQDTRL